MINTPRITKNPWLVFLPFFLLYLLIVILLRKEILGGDAGRYLSNAEDLLKGSYPYLWNAPGYPLFLVPFVLSKMPYITITICNAIFRYLSNVYLYRTIAQYTSHRNALLFSLFWALHYSTYELLPNINTESFTIFLITLIAYYTSICFLKVEKTRFTRQHLLLSAFIGLLVLTKAIFGYVLIMMLLLAMAYYFFDKNKSRGKNTILILVIAMIINVPYLIHTYQLSGRYFYWASSGGMSLYWMSTPYAWEYGDWQSTTLSQGFSGRDFERLKINHGADYDKVYCPYPNPYVLEVDSIFKEIAVVNIKSNPQKYVINCIANTTRLFFGIPNSFQWENLKFLKYAPPNIIILVLMLYSMLITLLNFSKIEYGIKALLIIVLFYLGLSILVSTEPRMFLIICPLLLLWIAYCVHHTLKLELFFVVKKKEEIV